MISQKSPRDRKIFCPQFWGRKWLRQFYGRLEKCVLSAGKTHVRKIPPFMGGGVGGGECRFYFYGREDFSEYPRGPSDQKNLISIEIFNLDRNFLISRENFNLDVSISPQKKGPR